MNPGAAVTAIPSNGTITACYAKNTGALRVIDTGQTCSSKETLLAWKDGSTLLGKNEKATDSDKLDNKDSTEFLGASQTAADSDKLDGLNSASFGRVLAAGSTDVANILSLPTVSPGSCDYGFLDPQAGDVSNDPALVMPDGGGSTTQTWSVAAQRTNLTNLIRIQFCNHSSVAQAPQNFRIHWIVFEIR
jgi:hypothetical protein